MTAQQAFDEFRQWVRTAEQLMGPVKTIITIASTWYQINRDTYRRMPYREFKRRVRGGK